MGARLKSARHGEEFLRPASKAFKRAAITSCLCALPFHYFET